MVALAFDFVKKRVMELPIIVKLSLESILNYQPQQNQSEPVEGLICVLIFLRISAIAEPEPEPEPSQVLICRGADLCPYFSLNISYS